MHERGIEFIRIDREGGREAITRAVAVEGIESGDIWPTI